MQQILLRRRNTKTDTKLHFTVITEKYVEDPINFAALAFDVKRESSNYFNVLTDKRSEIYDVTDCVS